MVLTQGQTNRLTKQESKGSGKDSGIYGDFRHGRADIAHILEMDTFFKKLC